MVRVLTKTRRYAEVTVDREGMVYVPHVGAIHVGGLAYSDVEKQVRAGVGRINGSAASVRCQRGAGWKGRLAGRNGDLPLRKLDMLRAWFAEVQHRNALRLPFEVDGVIPGRALWRGLRRFVGVVG